MRLSLLPKIFAFTCAVALAPVASAADMQFSTVPYTNDPTCGDSCPRLMQATGQITEATPQAFLAFARQQIQKPGLINVLLIHSPGGSVRSSMTFGRVIRKLGTVVVVARALDPRMTAALPNRGGNLGNPRFVSGTCASACVYTLAGGAKRVVPPESKVAVHRMAGNVGQIDPATREYQSLQIYAGVSEINELSGYIQQMGVNPALVGMAEAVPHEEARILTPREILKLNLAKPKL